MLDVFQFQFMQNALISSVLIGLMCSYMGVFVILKRITFVGIALAQVSALGVAFAVFFHKDPVMFSFLFTIAGVILLSNNFKGKKIPAEALIGISFAASWAFAILILSKSAHGEAEMLNLVQGNILGTTDKDIYQLLWVFIPAGAVMTVFYRQFLFSSFDPEMAETLGIRARLWNTLFYLILGLVVATSIKVAGVLLTFAFLLLPPITAIILGNSMRANFILSGVTAILSTFIGLILSFRMDLPTGPAIVGTGFIILILFSIIKNIAERIKKAR